MRIVVYRKKNREIYDTLYLNMKFIKDKKHTIVVLHKIKIPGGLGCRRGTGRRTLRHPGRNTYLTGPYIVQ